MKQTSSCSRTSSNPVSHGNLVFLGDWDCLPREVFQGPTSQATGAKPSGDGGEVAGEEKPEEVCRQTTKGTVVLTGSRNYCETFSPLK